MESPQDISSLPSGPPLRRPGGVAELLIIAIPMVVSQACEVVMHFFDRLFLSWVSPVQMSASLAGGIGSFAFMTFFMGVTGYANALVAQYYGAGRTDRCARASAQAVLLSLAAWPLLLAAIPLGLWIFAHAGISDEQLVHQSVYFRILLVGAPLALLRNSLSSFFAGVGRTRIVMVAAVMAMLVNVGVNYVLIFGHLGMPAMGIRGAAYGTLIGSACGLGVLLSRYFASSYREEFSTLRSLRFDRAVMGRLLRFGSPSGIEFLLILIAFNAMILNFHSYGDAVAAAVTITFNWDMVSFIPLMGVGIAVSSLVGRYMGAGQPDIAHRATMSGIKIACVYSGVMFTIVCSFPTAMVNVFRPPDAGEVFAGAMPLAIFMVRLIAVYVFGDALIITFTSALRGAGDTFWTMVLSVSGHWLMTGVVFVLTRLLRVEPRHAWLSVVGFVLLLAGLFLMRYRSGKWRSLRVVEPDGAEPPPSRPHDEMEIKL